MAWRKGFLTSGGSIGVLALVLAVLALVNFIGIRRFVRLDFTQNREYTTTASTRKILAGLDDVVNVDVYFSKDLPPYLANLDRQVKDLLDEYRAYSNGRLRIRFEDPGADPQKERSLQMLGIPKIQLNILEKEKAQVTNVYLGIAVQYGGKHEVIPVVQSTENLEYELTSAILKVSQPAPTLGLLTGSGEAGEQRGELAAAVEALRKQYDVSTVDVGNGQPVPAGVRTLLVARPQQRLTERTRYEIDQFLMRGGRAIFLADGMSIVPQSLTARPNDVGLADLLAHYGARINNDLVLDRSNVTTAFSSGYFSFMVPYPWFVRVQPENLSRRNPVTANLQSIVFPWVSTVEPTVAVDTTGAAGAGVKAEVLATTSAQSFRQQGNLSVNPQQRLQPPSPNDMKKFPVAVALTGSFSSFFAGKATPPPADSAAALAAPHPTTIDRSPPTQIVVVADADFALDQFVGQYPENRTFLMNLVDWCTMGDQLIAIRSRGETNRPLRPVSDSARATIKFANMLGMPLLVIAFGLLRWSLRRRSRAQLERYREAS